MKAAVARSEVGAWSVANLESISVQSMQRAVLIVSVLLGSWLGMQAVHELGHVLAAWLSGAHVERVVLHPLTISRTDFSVNPHPLVVTWAGPIVGVLVPLVVWRLAARLRSPWTFVARFFAGFCLVANGAYLAAGSLERIGDCGQLLSHGAALWQLWLFGIVSVPAGFWLWHGQGADFGLGSTAGRTNPRVAYGCLLGLGLLVAVELLLSER